MNAVIVLGQGKVLLSQQAARVIEFINGLNYIPSLSEIGAATGLSASTVWRIFKKLRDSGVWFKAVIDPSKLGLVEVLLIYRERISPERVPRIMLRLFVRTLEGATFIIYVSRVHEVEPVVNYVVSCIGREPSEVYVIDHVIAPRYVLSHLTRSFMDKLFVRELMALTVAPPLPSRAELSTKLDAVDVALVNALEENAFTRIKSVYEVLRSRGRSLSYQTILKHFKEHVVSRGAISGIRPALENLVERSISSSRKIFILSGTPSHLIKGVRALIGVPSFAEARLSSKEGVALVPAVLPLGLAPKVIEFLGLLQTRGLIESWTIHEVDPSGYLKLPIAEVLGEVSVSEALMKFRCE